MKKKKVCMYEGVVHRRHTFNLQSMELKCSKLSKGHGRNYYCTLIAQRSPRNKSWNKGLISADRDNKVTLRRTTPRSRQVVCKGFYATQLCFQMHGLLRTHVCTRSGDRLHLSSHQKVLCEHMPHGMAPLIQHGFRLRGVQP